METIAKKIKSNRVYVGEVSKDQEEDLLEAYISKLERDLDMMDISIMTLENKTKQRMKTA